MRCGSDGQGCWHESGQQHAGRAPPACGASSLNTLCRNNDQQRVMLATVTQSHLIVALSVVRRTPCVSLVCQQGAECSISSSKVVSNGNGAHRVQLSVGTNLAVPQNMLSVPTVPRPRMGCKSCRARRCNRHIMQYPRDPPSAACCGARLSCKAEHARARVAESKSGVPCMPWCSPLRCKAVIREQQEYHECIFNLS